MPVKHMKWGKVLNYDSDFNSNYHLDFNFIILIIVVS